MLQYPLSISNEKKSTEKRCYLHQIRKKYRRKNFSLDHRYQKLYGRVQSALEDGPIRR